MKKNIIIGLLTVVSLLLFTYSYIQKIEADNQREIARKNYEEAIRQRMIAEEQTKLAQQQQQIVQDLLATRIK